MDIPQPRQALLPRRMRRRSAGPAAAPARHANPTMGPRPCPQSGQKFQRSFAAAREPELEAAKITGGRIEQDEGAILRNYIQQYQCRTRW
jgi:hypothetical protein